MKMNIHKELRAVVFTCVVILFLQEHKKKAAMCSVIEISNYQGHKHSMYGK